MTIALVPAESDRVLEPANSVPFRRQRTTHAPAPPEAFVWNSMRFSNDSKVKAEDAEPIAPSSSYRRSTPVLSSVTQMIGVVTFGPSFRTTIVFSALGSVSGRIYTRANHGPVPPPAYWLATHFGVAETSELICTLYPPLRLMVLEIDGHPDATRAVHSTPDDVVLSSAPTMASLAML